MTPREGRSNGGLAVTIEKLARVTPNLAADAWLSYHSCGHAPPRTRLAAPFGRLGESVDRERPHSRPARGRRRNSRRVELRHSNLHQLSARGHSGARRPAVRL